MLINIISVTVLLYSLGAVFCENTFLNETIHIRVKRGKYYSYPSKFHRPPPNTYPIKGAFSLTPPPGYMADDEEPPYPGPGRPHDRPKVSKKPNDGLRDSDINNIVKYLSKQDLDKLIDMASEKERHRENFVERRPYKRDESRVIKDTEYSTPGFVNGPYKTYESDLNFGVNEPKQLVERRPFTSVDGRITNTVYSTQRFVNRPYKIHESDQTFGGNVPPIVQENLVEIRPYTSGDSRLINSEYATKDLLNNPYKNLESDHSRNEPWISQESDPIPFQFKLQEDYQSPFESPNTQKFEFNPQEINLKYNRPYAYAPTEDLLNYVEDATQSKLVYSNNDNTHLQTEESTQDEQISYLNAYMHQEINDLPKHAFVDNPREEVLPRPVNLREDDFDVSYTNNVPTVVKRPGYKVENFGDLPLMSNSYKLDTVSSYKVPHYTVTSNIKHSPPPPPSSSPVPLEPAPPVSAAKDQSDAHLKAIKIWTHRSPGTAYTLHSDGSLSLEKQRPKSKYGP